MLPLPLQPMLRIGQIGRVLDETQRDVIRQHEDRYHRFRGALGRALHDETVQLSYTELALRPAPACASRAAPRALLSPSPVWYFAMNRRAAPWVCHAASSSLKPSAFLIAGSGIDRIPERSRTPLVHVILRRHDQLHAGSFEQRLQRRIPVRSLTPSRNGVQKLSQCTGR